MPQTNEKLMSLLLCVAKIIALGEPLGRPDGVIDGYLIPEEIFIDCMIALDAFNVNVCTCPECAKKRLEGLH